MKYLSTVLLLSIMAAFLACSTQITPGPTTQPPAEPIPISVSTANPQAPTPTPTQLPTPTLTPTPTPTPTQLPTPTLTPTPVQTTTLAPSQEKEYFLALLNDVREENGTPPLTLGTNPAAQQHANEMLKGNFVGHWGLDGLKPTMRYTLASGADYVTENTNGVVLAEGITYRRRHRKAILDGLHTGLMDSLGHRENILNKWHTAVNLGIACNEVTCSIVQDFEGDYVNFDKTPAIANGTLSLSGALKGGFAFRSLQVWYDQPPQPLTLGQLDATYAYTIGQIPVTFLLQPAPAGFHYTSTDLTPASYSWTTGVDPYAVDPNQARIARYLSGIPIQPTINRTITRTAFVPWTIPETWRVSDTTFDIEANISKVIDKWGPGVYTIAVWGENSGEQISLSNYSIFHGIMAPTITSADD